MGSHRKKRSFFWAWFPAVLGMVWLGIWLSLAAQSPQAAFQRPSGVVTQPEHSKPFRTAQPPTSSTTAKYITVAKGSTLWSIARQYCGNGNDFRKIAAANGIKGWLIKPGKVMKV